MNLFASAPSWLVWPLIAVLAGAAAQDAIQLKIANIFSVAVLALAIAAMIAEPSVGLWQNCLVFAAVLTAGTMLFLRDAMGGGDAKLFAAVSLWADLTAGAKLVVSVLLCGGLLALLILLLGVVVPATGSRSATPFRGRKIPYGVAIAAGSLLVIAMSRPAI